MSGGLAHVGRDIAVVTLVEGGCSCRSTTTGDIEPGGDLGLFVEDLRLLSELTLTVNGERPEALDAVAELPFRATYLARTRPAAGVDATLVVDRRRRVGDGLRDVIVVRNLGEEATYCRLEVRAGADLAPAGAVRAGEPARPPSASHPAAVEGPVAVAGGLELARGRAGRRTGVRLVTRDPAVVDGAALVFEAIVAPHGEWRSCIEVHLLLDGELTVPPPDGPVDPAAERYERWQRAVPALETASPSFDALVTASARAIGTLRVADPEVPERSVVAAGAPWAMALHGRDALLTAWMALLVDPELALGVLETLARFQGRDDDPRTEEEPGRIPHAVSLGLGGRPFGGRRDYGAVDPTPLFVMLLGELRRWGLAPELVERLLPHADAALAWIVERGDRDHDGYVEYLRATDRGRRHQGWRDAFAAIRFADGVEARPPIALAEVQGYTYAAFVARAHFAREAGDAAGARAWRTRADGLRAAFNRDFWVDDAAGGFVAMGLDREKRPIDAPCSSAGHCLWTGILDEDKAKVVARRLTSPEFDGGFGVRTLGSSAAGWNPVAYQNGSVWPHDNAIVAAGLMRYGFVAEALQVVEGVLAAARALGGSLPEHYGGFDRATVPFPVRSPSSCDPQAWSAAAPLSFLRTLLRFEPWIPAGVVRIAPVLPASIGRIRIEGVPLLSARLSIEADGDAVKVEGLPSGVELITEPRPPLGGSPLR